MRQGKGDTLFIRKQATTQRDSCFKLIKDLIKKYQLSPLFTVYESTLKIVCKSSGRQMLFKGIDDPDSLKSIVGINRIIMEEANQLDLADFMELNRRARGMENIQMLLILNPVSENHWIKSTLCDAISPYASDTTILKFTYHNNKNVEGKSFLTDADIRPLEILKEVDENQYRIYVLGEWGVENKQGKFCWAFHNGQIVKTAHDKGTITWATFDFNRNPLTCTIAQVWPDKKLIRAIECIKLEDSDIWKMCDRIKAGYGSNMLWNITGDATGNSSSALVKDNVNYYEIICQQLNIMTRQLQVPTINPRIADNKLIVNACHKLWRVEIDPDKCKPLIYDLTYVEIDEENQIIKDRTSAKKESDFLDNWRYLINVAVKPFLEIRQ